MTGCGSRCGFVSSQHARASERENKIVLRFKHRLAELVNERALATRIPTQHGLRASAFTVDIFGNVGHENFTRIFISSYIRRSLSAIATRSIKSKEINCNFLAL